MPWGKDKPLGAFPAVYGQGLQALAAGTPIGAWVPLLEADSRVTAERLVIQGRVWSRLAIAQELHPVLRQHRVAFRWRGLGPGGAAPLVVEARLLPRKDTFEDIVASALTRPGGGTPMGG